MQYQNDRDQLFLIAESLAQDFSLFRYRDSEDIEENVDGLLSAQAIAVEEARIAQLDIDAYVETCIGPAEDPARPAAPSVIAELGGKMQSEISRGPFFSAVVRLDFGEYERDVGFIAQDRSVRNGEWQPEHHLEAARCIDEYSTRSMPIVSIMDTPGAAADEAANANNQAHSISRLIAEMCNVDVPNIGLVLGVGYSGGAIPLAASNLILSVRDGVFNTIQPRGLASIARRYNLSWQECAKHVGVCAVELYRQRNLDGIIDYIPGEGGEKFDNFRRAIISGIRSVEDSTRQFVADNPYILEHYARSLKRYLNPSPQAKLVETSASLSLTKSPTEYHNAFGIGYRYLRYLGVRRRIKATTISQYGRLAKQTPPRGHLEERAQREHRVAFLRWLQDPERIAWDDGMARAHRIYQDRKLALRDERSRIAAIFLGEPKQNYEEARADLLTTVGMYLYNRWKVDAGDNLAALRERLVHYDDTQRLLRVGDLLGAPEDCRAWLADSSDAFPRWARENFGYDARRLLGRQGAGAMSEAALRALLVGELNLLLTGGEMQADPTFEAVEFSTRTRRITDEESTLVARNRSALGDLLGDYLAPADTPYTPESATTMTVMDVLLESDVRDSFIIECENLLLFDVLYNEIIGQLDTVAEEARDARALSLETVQRLLDNALRAAAGQQRFAAMTSSEGLEERVDELRTQITEWFGRLSAHGRHAEFLRAVEEWKKGDHPALSDTLFVVLTFFFESLVPSWIQATTQDKRFNGRIAPRNIGQRKDFWNRLAHAYRDLLIQQTLERLKAAGGTSPEAFIDRFFSDFEEINEHLLSSDPVEFPGFRQSIERALERHDRPSGIVTGIGTLNHGTGSRRVGAVISNVAFQAGAFDMASAEKFCKLLVECAQQGLPVVCFIASGGMQTKEGAGALFSMAAVNDRITRFVRDNDLPVIVFGFRDCTGGAQASFVTHPLVQTYYFSGTDMPFAGQIVVTSHLPFTCRLSNYLSRTPGAMQGLVRHPLHPELDAELRAIDPNIPVPVDEVADVVARVFDGGALVARQPDMATFQTPTRTDSRVHRVLIHARGCTAAKLIRVAQREHIPLVLVQSDPDMDSVPAEMLGEADELVCIGGNTSDQSYLNAMSVLQVAQAERVDALHPGIGFLSENSSFAELCRNHGINFIGPSAHAMDTMGNKSNAINTARELGVQVVPGSHGVVANPVRAAEVADTIGYPVLIKAVHGGGGKGIQVVEAPADFAELFHQVAAEARSAFGNGDLYLEKYVGRMRHIEVQVLRDSHRNTQILGLRDCSVQRNKQKVVEESDSTVLPEALREQAFTHARALADGIDYEGAGTVEFIFDLDAQQIYFMEMNTRLQVEHPVTEAVTGVDIVAQQFRIASGDSIGNLRTGRNGYAIEARVNAERALLDGEGRIQFRPDPGRMTRVEFPEADDVDVITMAGTGKVVPPFYDSMIAQVVVHGANREDTIDRLASYLDEVVIEGIATNIPVVQAILADQDFRTGDFDTSLIEHLFERIDLDALVAAQSSHEMIDADAIRIEGSSEFKVLAPATGMFYITPSPSEPEYVSEGSIVDVHATLCQMEAMKVFSALTLWQFNTEVVLYSDETQWRVKRVNPENGQQVNVGDLLFIIEPVPL